MAGPGRAGSTDPDVLVRRAGRARVKECGDDGTRGGRTMMFVGEIFTVIVARLLWIHRTPAQTMGGVWKRASQSPDGGSAQPIMGHNERTNNLTGRLISASDEVSAAFAPHGGLASDISSAAFGVLGSEHPAPPRLGGCGTDSVWRRRRRRRRLIPPLLTLKKLKATTCLSPLIPLPVIAQQPRRRKPVSIKNTS